jgi:hypothetical protein
VFHVETSRQKNPVELSILTLTDREREARVKITGEQTSLFSGLRFSWSESRAAKKATSPKVAFFVSTIALSYMVLPPGLQPT